MIGEINGSSTLSETPSPAIMKANSPICARLNPDLMEVFSGSPDKSTPNEEKNGFADNGNQCNDDDR